MNGTPVIYCRLVLHWQYERVENRDGVLLLQWTVEGQRCKYVSTGFGGGKRKQLGVKTVKKKGVYSSFCSTTQSSFVFVFMYGKREG